MDKLKVFKALSNDNRLKIIELLDNEYLCACKLLEELNVSQSTISHHMKILEEANLVQSVKDGKWKHYSINAETFNSLKNYFARENNAKEISCLCNK